MNIIHRNTVIWSDNDPVSKMNYSNSQKKICCSEEVFLYYVYNYASRDGSYNVPSGKTKYFSKRGLVIILVTPSPSSLVQCFGRP
jgi:hypothetical protein